MTEQNIKPDAESIALFGLCKEFREKLLFGIETKRFVRGKPGFHFLCQCMDEALKLGYQVGKQAKINKNEPGKDISSSN